MRYDENFVVTKQWIKSTIDNKADVFISIKYHNKIKSVRYIEKQIKDIMKRLNKQLMGRHWYKKGILKFIAFLERGKSGFLHVHAILNSSDYRYEDILEAFTNISRYIKYDIGYKELNHKVNMKSRFYNRNIVLSEVYSDEVFDYVMKELNINFYYIKSSNIMTYNMFFKDDL